MDANKELKLKIELLMQQVNELEIKLLVSTFLSKYGKSTSVRMKNVKKLLSQLGFNNE